MFRKYNKLKRNMRAKFGNFKFNFKFKQHFDFYFSLCLVHVRGKRGRQVPVLLTCVEESAIEVIIRYRDAIGINKENLYVFAAPTRDSKNFLRGNDVMCKLLKDIKGLQSPERIRSTELRKYCATVTQIADLGEGDLRWLAEHMGHNIDVHREYYRLKESTVELTKVSRLLLAIDEGKAHNFAGKKLSEIDVEGEFFNATGQSNRQF